MASDILLPLWPRQEGRSPEEVASEYFYGDGIHLKPEGDRKIAQFLYDLLAEKDLLHLLFESDGPFPSRPVDGSRAPGEDLPLR